MSQDPFDVLGGQLREVVRRQAGRRRGLSRGRPLAGAPAPTRTKRSGALKRSFRTAMLIGLVLLAGGAALAASQLIGRSVPARPGPPLLGGAQPGTVEILPVREPDPVGGPAWGLRLYTPKTRHAKRIVCLQVGRLADGRFGVLGQDDAFSNDGLLHPLQVQPSDGCTSSVVTIGPEIIAASGSRTPGGCATPGQRQASRDELASIRRLLRRKASAGGSLLAAAERRDLATTAAPRCPRSDLRLLFYGAVDARARRVALTGPGLRRTEILPAGDRGGFIFVLPLAKHGAPSVDQLHLTVQVAGP